MAVFNSGESPLVSVVMPAYNHEKFVEEAILSVANQTYDNIELIIIDDGSTDSTRECIASTLAGLDRDLKVQFHCQANAGVCATLNRALTLARGEFVQFLASDDAYLNEKTQRSVAALNAAGELVAAVYCDGFIVDSESRRTGILFSNLHKVPFSQALYKELLVANWIPAIGLLYRRSVLEDLGGFDEALRFEDWDFLLRLTQRYQIQRISDALFLYRLHGNNLHNNEVVISRSTSLIIAKHKKMESYMRFKSAVFRRAPRDAWATFNLGNLDLMAREVFRWVQYRIGSSKGGAQDC